MKLIIAGGRDYQFTVKDYEVLDQLKDELGVTQVVHGGANGADAAGKAWAQVKCIPSREFQAQWCTYGKAAGPVRNRKMAEYADALVAFPGGKGTANMVKVARELGLRVIEVG